MITSYLNGTNLIPKKHAHSLLKSTGAFFAGAFLVMAFASGAGASESSMEFQAIGKRLIGTWSGSGTYSTDYPGVGKKGDKFVSKSTCRWAAGRSAILCESVAGDARKGVTVQGSGLLSANIVSAEPLTAALFPVASQAETACDEYTSGRNFRS